MQATLKYLRGSTPEALFIDMLDRAMLLFWAHMRQNARRLTNLLVTMVPMIALLVGSCKTSELSFVYNSSTASEQFRTALFPDRVNFSAADYRPAAGYISRAQDFVAEQPQALMMLTRQEIGFLFGEPQMNRKDADAEVWQYKAGGCAVDFYFYGQGTNTRLSYVDVRTSDELVPGAPMRETPVSAQEKTSCMHDIVEKKQFSTTQI